MSLINDALKKAQRERSGENPPAQPPPAAPPPPPTPVHPAPAAASSGFKGWPIVAVAALVVVGFLGWRMLGPTSEPDNVAAAETSSAPPVTTDAAPPQTQPASPAVEPAATLSEPAPAAQSTAVAPDNATAEKPAPESPPATVVQSTPTPEPPPAIVVKTEPAQTAPAQPVVSVTIPSTTPATTAGASSVQELPATMITIPEGPTGSSPAAPLVSVRQQDPRVLAYLDALTVNGIRPSPDDPKVLMNNRVFRIQDVVDRELKLRLTAIAPNKLTFEDERGMPYVKSF